MQKHWLFFYFGNYEACGGAESTLYITVKFDKMGLQYVLGKHRKEHKWKLTSEKFCSALG